MGCDKVLVMDGGRVADNSPAPPEVLKRTEESGPGQKTIAVVRACR